MPAATPVLSVRITSNERRLLEAAAEQSRVSLSDFVRRTALEAAEIELMTRSRIVIPAADWERFEQWASAPARDSPALRRLAAHKPAWRD
jgi:uncharacterized protein (DUF1778 family)